MPILERQLRKLTERSIIETLRKGRVPSSVEVALGIAEFLSTADGGPTMKVRYQAKRGLWDHRKTNLVFRDMAFDLDIAHEEVVEQVRRLVDRTSFIDLVYMGQRQQIDALLSLVKNLAFVSKNTEDNFFGVFDSFDDMTKVDLALTTRDAVDLSEGVVLLPHNDITGDRVDVSHLYNRQSWPIEVFALPTGEDTPSSEDTADTETPPVGVVQSEPAPNQWFGLAFSDMVNAWRHIVTTGSGSGAKIDFVVPITPFDNDFVSISRLEMAPAATHSMFVTLRHSRDNINWLKFPGVDDNLEVRPGRKTGVDFETTAVRFVRYTIELRTPTVAEGVSNSYIFGFRNLSYYKLGRAQQAEFTSRPLSAEAMEKAIDKVSISTFEQIPAGCNVNWFVAAADANGAPRDGIWRPITPLTRAPIEGIPQIVKFNESATKTVYLAVPEPSIVHVTTRNVDFYRLTDSPLPEEPLFQQSFLYRGNNGWWRNTDRETVTRAVKDSFIDFNSGDVQKLYAVTTEAADIETSSPGSSQVGARTVLRVGNPIDYDSATMLLVPPEAVDPSVDQRPRYAVYQVLRYRNRMRIEDEAIVLNGTTWSQLSNSGVGSVGSDRPVVTNTAGSVTYVEGIDYLLETDTNGRLTGRLRRIKTTTVTSNIGDGDSVNVTYGLDPDVTHLVYSISEDKVTLTKDLGTVSDQSFQVSYRFVPLPENNEIKKATVKITSQYGQNEGVTYQEGRDYLVDVKKGTITRVPGGLISQELVSFADFRYQETPKDLDTFSTWMRVERRDPFVVEVNPQDLDLEAGERILLNGVDVSRSTTWPELVFGWHKVVVRSKRPEAFDDAAINKMARLRDRTDEPVMIAQGKYFAEMTSSRIPLLQRTVTQLTKNTPPTNHNFFAITTDKHVILNFEPGSTGEIYTFGLRRVTGTVTEGTWPEEFRLEYTHALETTDPVNNILVRATLDRNRDTDGGITPKIYEYHGRLA